MLGSADSRVGPAGQGGAPFGDGRMPLLFTAKNIGAVRIRNRVVMPSMTTRGADAEGFITDDVVSYYNARADGGVGLITVEMSAPEKVGRHRRFELGIYDDRFLPGLTRLVAGLHERGAAVSIQLGHGGGHTRADICGEPPIAPSAVPHVVQEGTTETVVPEEMTPARIERTIEAFVEGAARAQKAGIDIVEVHAAHGYLISQFLTPAENRRTDEFGGSLENRARIGVEIVRRIKVALPELPVIFRLNADDFFPGGMVFAEAEQVAVWSVEAGADAVHVTAGHYRSQPSAAIMIPPMAEPEATFLNFAAAIRRRVSVPVIAVGRLGDPARAIRAVEEGDADFVALGRPLLADPEWVAKACAGRPVRMCIACNTCVDGMRTGGRLHCLVNPATGRERRFGNTEASQALRQKGKRIAVVGAGPAGLTFAALASRQNTVTVFEKAAQAGGAFRLAGLAPTYQGVKADPGPMLRFVAGLEAACRAQGVNFRFSTDAAAQPALLDGFDEIILATGAVYRFGLGPVLTRLVQAGALTLPGFRRLAQSPRMRDWFYHRARRADPVLQACLAAEGRRVTVIGDAKAPGKTANAIFSAFEAALVTVEDAAAASAK